jgi:hypothetical protein
MKLLLATYLLGVSWLCSAAHGDSEWLTPPAAGVAYPSGESDRQWAVLSYDLTQKTRFAGFASETYCADALVTEADRDPLDILLRRTTLLLDDVRMLPGSRALAAEQQCIENLRSEAALTAPGNAAERRALFDHLLVLRRRIAFAFLFPQR